MVMQVSDLKGIVVMIAMIALIGGSVGIAIDDFKEDQEECAAGFVANGSNPGNLCNNGSDTIGSASISYNISHQGVVGVDNSTQFLDTTGTIAGVAVLISLVIAAFAFGRR